MTVSTKKNLLHKFSRLDKYNNIVFKFLNELSNEEKEFLEDFLYGLTWKELEYKYRENRTTLWRKLEHIIIQDYITKNIPLQQKQKIFKIH